MKLLSPSHKIYETEDKKKYFELLLLADEQPQMIEKYLYNCKMFVIDDNGVKGEICILEENGVLEIKSLAVYPQFQRLGYGKTLIDFVCKKYRAAYPYIQVGTGDSPLTVPFYKKCGFCVSHTVKDFFTDNYDHAITEGGVQLKDMIYLIKNLT